MENVKPANISKEDLEKLDRLQNEVTSCTSGKNVVLVAYEKQ